MPTMLARETLQNASLQRLPSDKTCVSLSITFGLLLLLFPLSSHSASVLPEPPAAWGLSGATLYSRLYDTMGDSRKPGEDIAIEVEELPPIDSDGDGTTSYDEILDTQWISDRIITGVAADLVVQFYTEGTENFEAGESDLIVPFTDDLVPLPPRELILPQDFPFEEVKLWVRRSLSFDPTVACSVWPWWTKQDPPPEAGSYEPSDPLGAKIPYFLCEYFVVDEVRDAIKRELELEDLRQELTLIAYGSEAIWDGQSEGTGTQLRTYDLLLDLAGAGNVLGSAMFQSKFRLGNQGEQCDSRACPMCIAPPQLERTCGDEVLQGPFRKAEKGAVWSALTEQCDDGNTFPGDGCDEFCQVEGEYCGNGNKEPWEFCEELDVDGVLECPDGTPCENYAQCTVGGALCTHATPDGCRDAWSRTCRLSGITCDRDIECPCPIGLSFDECAFWRKNACRYVFDGVCWYGKYREDTGGGIIEGSSCTTDEMCSGISSCIIPITYDPNVFRLSGVPGGFCTDMPFTRCDEDADCFSCSEEEVWGTCYVSGERCNGNEDCVSEYCVLEPESACRRRTIGGALGADKSTCNEFCEDITRCGDGITYLDESGGIEQCDDGMQCADGTFCFFGQTCGDGSVCKPRDLRVVDLLRNRLSTPYTSCMEECSLQVCGNGVTQDPEGCDTGAKCSDGTHCTITDPNSCTGVDGTCNSANPVITCNMTSPCPAGAGVCTIDASCLPRSDDADACTSHCIPEFCGDSVTQTSSPPGPESCDNGGECPNGSFCSGYRVCLTYSHCLGYDTPCSTDSDCPSPNAAVPLEPGTVQCGIFQNCPVGTQCEEGFCEGTPRDVLHCSSYWPCPAGMQCVESGGNYSCAGSPILTPSLPNPTLPGRCLPANPEGASCTPRSEDGCDGTCAARESCGDGIKQNGPWPTDLHEQCDAGTGCHCAVLQPFCPGFTPFGSVSCDTALSVVCSNGAVPTCQSGMTPFCTADGNPECPSPCVQGATCSLSEGASCGGWPFGQCAINSCVTTPDGPCTATCELYACGDGKKECSEECDDGNTVDGDGCNTSCEKEFCGDGLQDADGPDGITGTIDDEQCEPDTYQSHCNGGPNNGALCTTTADCAGFGCAKDQCPVNNCNPGCKVSELGNCRVDCGEQCDDANSTAGDGCNNGVREYCGDSSDNNGTAEECDPPLDPAVMTKHCSATGDDCTGNPSACTGLFNFCTPDPNQCGVNCRLTRPRCPPCTGTGCAVCGNGCREPGEECEDFNTSSNDGCSSSCKGEYCGDNTLNNALEECDLGKVCKCPASATGCVDGNDCTTNPGACGTGNCVLENDTTCVNCRSPVCGNCKVESPAEECERFTFGFLPCFGFGCVASPFGFNDDCVPAGGTNECTFSRCGDAVTDGDGADEVAGTLDDEECDDGGLCFDGTTVCDVNDRTSCPTIPHSCTISGGACSGLTDCSPGGGECREVQTSCIANPCDGCSSQCEQIFCGNGRKECREECDDGNIGDGDGCSGLCEKEFCGDGYFDANGGDDITGTFDDEECDEGWDNSDTASGACRTNCEQWGCGDGVVDPGEQCDTPAFPDSGCSTQCRFEGCGNFLVEPEYKEECDDGGLCQGNGASCSIDTSDTDCGPGIPCIPVSGDGCNSSCKPDMLLCGDGTVQASGGDGIAGTVDDEECDDRDLASGFCPAPGLACTCPNGGTDCAPSDAFCDIGPCVPATRRCMLSDRVCTTDEDCITSCVNSCTPFCKNRVHLCGDGYRDLDEQCDDGNRQDGDGCSFFCEVERPDLCGNGIFNIDEGEECDQGHPLRSTECTPYCRLPHPPAMCGNGRRDASGDARGDVLGRLLSLDEGYRLDRRFPGGLELFPTQSSRPAPDEYGAAGWYVTPRIATLTPETPFLDSYERKPDPEETGIRSCPLCGNGVKDADEQCDSGFTGALYPNQRVNALGWGRAIWSWNVVRYAIPYFWRWYQTIYPFSSLSFEQWWQNWGVYSWSVPEYVRFFMDHYGDDWWFDWDFKKWEKRVQVRQPCTAQCTLQLCGNGTIDDGETCDEGGTCFGGIEDGEPCTRAFAYRFTIDGPVRTTKQALCALLGGRCVQEPGDGCSENCAREGGFDFTSPQVCGDDVISMGEQCDFGGVCKRVDGGLTRHYCRVGEFSTYCSPAGDDGVLGILGSDEYPDNEVDCVQVQSGACQNCQVPPVNVCGNGSVETYEECDDGCRAPNVPLGCDDTPLDNGDGCEANCLRTNSPCETGGCTSPFCGDGTLDFGEECDDGNFVRYDGCTYCTSDLCGNSRVDIGETCDDGNRTNGDGCSLWCLKELICGNSEIDPGEQCDDGDALSGDGCSESCQWEYCGDSVVQPGLGEECDDGPGNSYSPGACRETCQMPTCGDLHPLTLNPIVDTDEACDPGLHCAHDNAVACLHDYQCPLGPCYIPSGEDEGVCVHDEEKICDEDADCLRGECTVTDTPSCLANCTRPAVCGNATLEIGEECEPPGSGCTGACLLEKPDLCGNSERDPGEDCDDGNRADHDGCTETCQEEPMVCGGSCSDPDDRYVCPDGTLCQLGGTCTPGSCTLRAECASECVFGYCGNGIVNAGEQCDDGRQCTNIPANSCTTHEICTLSGDCSGGDPTEGIPGTCANDPARSCMSGEDCQGFCLPLNGDGCSAHCQWEREGGESRAVLTLCQEEGGRTIGSKEVPLWKETLLDPERNPFMRYTWYSNPIGTYWYWRETRSTSLVYGCGRSAFPNSIGRHIQSIAQCLSSLASTHHIPDQSPIMPYMPRGVVSFQACMEPRAELTSVVELPSPPPLQIPPYRPHELVQSLERFLCQESGLPPLHFTFLCADQSRIGDLLPDPSSLFELPIISLETEWVRKREETALAHALDIGYRVSEQILTQFIEEAVLSLGASLDAAIQLFHDLLRVHFADTVCPLDGTALCP